MKGKKIMFYKYQTYRNEEGKPHKVVAIGISNNGVTYIGEAKCAPTDNFDFAKGAKIARLRAEKKQLVRIMDSTIEKLDEELVYTNRLCARIEDIIDKMDKIDEMIEAEYGEDGSDQ